MVITLSLLRATYLLVNDGHQFEAERLFGALGTQIVAGHEFLDVIWVIMLVIYKTLHVSDKVQLWVTNLLSLTKVAVKEPQAAYAALTKLFQNEWTLLFSGLLQAVTMF